MQSKVLFITLVALASALGADIAVDKETNVYFEAYRKTDYWTPWTVLPYDECSVNVGGGMNCTTGDFFAPVRGLYQFHLSTYSTFNEANLALFKDPNYYFMTGAKVEKDQNGRINSYASMSHIFLLEAGQRVHVFFQTGWLSGLVNCGECYHCTGDCVHTVFTGALIKEL